MIVGFIKERFYQSQCHGNGGTCHEYLCIVCSVTDILKNRDSESVCERERERQIEKLCVLVTYVLDFLCSVLKLGINSFRIQSFLFSFSVFYCFFFISETIYTLFVNCVSIMKLCTCFSARVSSSLRDTTATSSAVQPAP